MKKLGLAVALTGFLFLVVFYWGLRIYGAAKPSRPHEMIVVEVKQGETFNNLVRELEKNQLVDNESLFTLYAKLKGLAGKAKVGEYAVYRDMSPLEILQTVDSGKSIGENFTLVEGASIFDLADEWEEQGLGSRESILELLQDKDYVKELLGEDHPSFEGYLFPETYKITKFTDPKALIAIMVKRFLKVWADLADRAKDAGMSRAEVVNLASIIEKETGAPEERPVISSVFHNRLRKGMLLQTDPTIIYGKALKTGKIVINITKADLTTPDPYNSYLNKGLPPGPISNPGREALRSAIEPAQTEFLYFVSKNQGTHVFSKDYSNHLEAVRKYQMDPKAREGKSWRDLKRPADKN